MPLVFFSCLAVIMFGLAKLLVGVASYIVLVAAILAIFHFLGK